MHQSIPSTNIGALFSHGQTPAPEREHFAKISPPPGKKRGQNAKPGEIFYLFNTVIIQ